MKFTVEFDVPDGTTIRVNPADFRDEMGRLPPGDAFVPPFADELIPIPEAIPDPTPFRGAAQNPSYSVCPVHRVPWKLVPAGISKKSGKPYGAFSACPERGCDQRPAA